MANQPRPSVMGLSGNLVISPGGLVAELKDLMASSPAPASPKNPKS